MGVDYAAVTVVGCPIDPSKLYTRKTVKAFEHNFGPDMKFCPQTGRSLWQESSEPIALYEDYEHLGEFEVISEEDADEVYVGLVSKMDPSGEGGEVGFIDPREIASVKKALKHTLDMIGEWDEERFGIYTILRVC